MLGDQGTSYSLICAVREGRLERVRELISCYGLSYSQAWSEGYVLLRDAVEEKHTEVAKLLLMNGSKVNSKNSYRNPTDTPLHFAVINGDIEIVKMLLDRGADTNVKNFFGMTPLHNAVESKKTEIIELLVKQGADVNATGNVNGTPFHCALEQCSEEIIKLLLSRVANVDAKGKDGTTYIHIAAERGYLQVVEHLLKRGAYVNPAYTSGYREGYTPLCLAVKEGHEKVVKLLLECGANVNAQDKDGKTVLHFAVEKGHEEVVRLLLECGANVNAQGKDGKSVLHIAVEKGHEKFVKLLLECGANVNAEDKDVKSLLHYAVEKQHQKVVQLLLECGANVNAQDKDVKSVLHYAVEKLHQKVVQLLLECGANVNAQDKDGKTLLHYAAEKRHETIFQLLLECGANIHAEDKGGKTVLHYAVEKQHEKFIHLLIECGANVNAEDKDGKSVLHYAVEKRHETIIQLLLECRANVHAEGKGGKTVLHYAVEKFIHLLIECGANVNAQDKGGKSVLHYAVEKRDETVFQLLLECGANVHAEDKGGKTVLHYAVKKQHEKFIHLLVECGANVNAQDKDGKTVLHLAVEEQHEKIVQLLLECGANVDGQDKDGKTVLHIAVEEGRSVIIEHLLKHCPDVNNKSNSHALNVALCGYGEEYDKIFKNLLQYGFTVNPEDVNNCELLHAAVKKGYLKVVEELLKYGIDVNKLYKSTYGKGYMPLHVATVYEQEEVAELLISCGADVNAEDEDGKTVLHLAVEKQHKKIVHLLLECGANVDGQDKDGKTVLHLAVVKGCSVIIERVLKHCPDVNNKSNRSALNVAVQGSGEEYGKIVENLLQYGFTVNPEDVNNCEFLHAAVKKGYLKIVEELLKYGIDVNKLYKSTYGKGYMALHVATEYKQEEVAKLLISYGADVNAQDGTGKTAIFYAIENADLKITELLLTNKANVKDNPELLNIAVLSECREIVEVLLEHGADVNTSDEFGRTALHFTALGKDRVFFGYHLHKDPDINVKGEIAKLLLRRGANVNAETKNGITTLHGATQKGYVKVVEALLEHNADVNCTVKTDIGSLYYPQLCYLDSESKYDSTPLHIAVQKGHLEIVRGLLKFGAIIDSQDEHGRTALHIASKEGHQQIVTALLEHGSDVNIMSKDNRTPFDFAVAGISEVYRSYHDFDSDQIAYILKHHMVKMKTANLFVSKKNLCSISSSDHLSDFQNECEEEIASMKSEKFRNANVSFYDILTKDISHLARPKEWSQFHNNVRILCDKVDPEEQRIAMKILNVAEKNNAAKNLASYLSGGNLRRREGLSTFNKIYEFECDVFKQRCQMIMTSVSGHLSDLDFTEPYEKWQACSPMSLFDAPVEKYCPQEYEQIKCTLEEEAEQCESLIIWTDCDREGENIGFEIIQVCLAANENLRVYRAKFSEITARSVQRALQTLAEPNKSISNAVEVRQELDLRTGAAFTRFQTLTLRKVFPQMSRDSLISYGSCLFPTLGFVVERFNAVKKFKPKRFWKIRVTHKIDGLSVEFEWKSVPLCDQESCQVSYDKCKEQPVAKVENFRKERKNKERPLPLDTLELEKLGSKELEMNAKEMMKIAEKLYRQGLISYPRTDTNIFPEELNLHNLIELQAQDPAWGEIANRILRDGPNPRAGEKSDQAHPPIHPTKHTTSLQGKEKKVYDFVVRHFLACCSEDAQGVETNVAIDIAGEKFITNGLTITELNYLEVYPYEKWNAKEIHIYQREQTFEPTSIEMVDGETNPPQLLTEADLIALMEKHGIGTVATHAVHIETIKSQRYVRLQNGCRFVPSELGMGLVEGYDNMGDAMSKPNLRAELEADLKRICDGTKDPKDVLTEQLDKYKKVFQKASEQPEKIVQAVTHYLQEPAQQLPLVQTEEQELNQTVLQCPSCGTDMVLRNRQEGSGKSIDCMGYPDCKNTERFPDNVEAVELSGEFCSECGPPVKKLKFKFHHASFYPYYRDDYTGCIGGCDLHFLKSLGISLSSVRPTQATNGPGDDNDEVLCQCGVPAKRLTVQKDSPNRGRQFYKCSKQHEHCKKFFKWADDINPGDDGRWAGASSGSTSGGRGAGQGGKKRPGPTSSVPPKKRKCGICKQEGHNRKTCPNLQHC